jgi:hypothetical protein
MAFGMPLDFEKLTEKRSGLKLPDYLKMSNQYGFPGFAMGLGPQQLAQMQKFMQGQGWLAPYLAGRDVLGKERAHAEKRMGETFADRGTYGQGPHVQGQRGLKQEYAGALSKLLANLQGGGMNRQMALIQLLSGMKSEADWRDLYEQQMNKSWLSSLFSGIGSMASAPMYFGFKKLWGGGQ